jgi:TonB family protein
MLNLRALVVLAAIAATPSPTATQPACPPDRQATVTNAMSPDYPDSARDLGLGPVTVVVDVTVSPIGNIAGLNLAQSSGNPAIDVASMIAALKSTYQARIVACKGVTGHYLFRAEFNPN